MGLPMYEEMSDITLNGIIKELGSPSFFKVPINKEQSIYELKEEIYERVKDSMPDINCAISIKVWSIQEAQVLCNDQKFEQLRDTNATVENVLKCDEITSSHLVKDYFNNLNASKIHIVVQGVLNWCWLCHKGFEDEEEFFEHRALDQQHQRMILSNSAGFIKESRERAKLDELNDETVVENKPKYKSKWEYDKKEGDNILCNSGEYPDSDD